MQVFLKKICPLCCQTKSAIISLDLIWLMLMANNYQRILLKFSGEVLAGQANCGIDFTVVKQLVDIIQSVRKDGTQIAVVIGGGNFFRGTSLVAMGSKKTTADHIGMLGTVINAMAIYDTLEQHGIAGMVMSAYQINNGICQMLDYKNADKFLYQGGVVIFCAGTGNPFFTTDTAAALRGIEIGADILVKATKVDGIYDSDPMKNRQAKHFRTLSFSEAIKKNLKVMDTSAFALCRENNLPIGVLNVLDNPTNLNKMLQGEPIGTIVRSFND